MPHVPSAYEECPSITIRFRGKLSFLEEASLVRFDIYCFKNVFKRDQLQSAQAHIKWTHSLFRSIETGSWNLTFVIVSQTRDF